MSYTPGLKVKITRTPIARWESPRGKRKSLVLYRVESTRSGLSYAYQGDGCSGAVRASDDAEAAEYVARCVVPSHGKLNRVGDS